MYARRVGGLICIVSVFFVVMFVIASSAGRAGGGGGGFFGGGVYGLEQSGTPARGIMLSVSSTGTVSRNGQVRYDLRNARVDVEPVGGQPYVVNTTLYIPSSLVRDVLPGSTMELRVSPSDPSRMLVVGPDVGYAQGTVRTS